MGAGITGPYIARLAPNSHNDKLKHVLVAWNACNPLTIPNRLGFCSPCEAGMSDNIENLARLKKEYPELSQTVLEEALARNGGNYYAASEALKVGLFPRGGPARAAGPPPTCASLIDDCCRHNTIAKKPESCRRLRSGPLC